MLAVFNSYFCMQEMSTNVKIDLVKIVEISPKTSLRFTKVSRRDSPENLLEIPPGFLWRYLLPVPGISWRLLLQSCGDFISNLVDIPSVISWRFLSETRGVSLRNLVEIPFEISWRFYRECRGFSPKDVVEFLPGISWKFLWNLVDKDDFG